MQGLKPPESLVDMVEFLLERLVADGTFSFVCFEFRTRVHHSDGFGLSALICATFVATLPGRSL